VLCRDICAAAVSSSAAACSTVGGARSALGVGVWRGGGRGGRTGGGGVRPAAAYLWDTSVPVEMDEIDSMDKLDAALAYSIESKQPVIIDWYYDLCLCLHNLPCFLSACTLL
jgi:hypothetical protein